MPKKNILYISYDGMTDPLGQSQVLPYLVGLSQKGYRFTLISFEKSERYEKNKEIIQKICDNATIKWVPLQYTKKPPVLSTIWDIYQLNKKVKKLHKSTPFDILHCRSYISSLIGLGMKRKHGTKFIFDMRGFWADERVEGNLWNLKNPLFKLVYDYFKKKEKQFLTESDHTISLTHKGKEVIETELYDSAVQTSPISVIPCCVDTQLFDSSKVNKSNTDKLRESLSINTDQPVLGYIGSIGTWYMLSEMVDYFKELLTQYPKAIFLFITREDSQVIKDEFAKKEISEKHLRITPSSRNDVPSYISLFSWSIFFVKPAFSKQASSPTKQGEIMALGVPIICNTRVGDTDKVIKDYDAGILIDAFNSDKYQSSLSELSTEWDLEKIRRGSEEFYSLEEGINKYEAVYKKLLN